MAEKIAAVEDFLNCRLCVETFRDPVSLSCNHSFCSDCLQQFWEQDATKNCPICRRRSSKEAIINFALKELADVFARRQKDESSETKGGEGKLPEEHTEEQFAWLNEELIKRKLKSLREKRKKYKHVEKTYDDMIQLSKTQLLSTERQITAEFNKLHQFLREEEESRLAALREEEEHKGKTISTEKKKIQEHISSLSLSISAVKEKLQKHSEDFPCSYGVGLRAARAQRSLSDPQLLSGVLPDVAEHLGYLPFGVWEKMGKEEHKGKTISTEKKKIQEHISFLSLSISAVEEKPQKHSEDFPCSYGVGLSAARAQRSLSDPPLLSGVLPDVAKHLGNLSFRVWEKMGEKVRFSPVILDPNTADPRLHLSEDLTSVRNGDTQQMLPDNPERFTFYPEVLGSEGFSSGTHSWEVDVGDHPYWIVGLAKESVDRKGKTCASPKYGYWCLSYRSGKYTNGVGGTLSVKKSLQKIRVELDYDDGEVSFYDPEDYTHIYTHSDSFTEKLFPYFYFEKASEAQTKELRVCQLSAMEHLHGIAAFPLPQIFWRQRHSHQERITIHPSVIQEHPPGGRAVAQRSNCFPQ